MVRTLMPREYILKPQTGQKWRIGLVSRVKIFFVPLIEMLEMKMSASSKFNNSVILFICLLSKEFRCRIIIRKETKKGKKSRDFLPCFNMCGDPTKCPYGFSLLIDPTKGCPH